MIEEEKTSRAFSRRNFITGAAVLTAAGALAGCSAQSDDVEEADTTTTECPDEIYAGVCRGNCAGGCFLDVHVRDGQVVRTTARDLPNTDYNRICSKGMTHVGRIYSARRLQYPMRRIEGTERGTEEFERITWDEAFDELITKWQGYVTDYGPAAMAVQYGSGNYAICSGVGLGGAVNRFMNATGTAYIANNVDAAHGHIATQICTFGLYGAQNEPHDFRNSDTIICWGANPAVSQPQIMHFILDAQAAGSKYIVIDPMFNANAAKADKYIPINPSTDGVLAFGVLKILMDSGTLNEDFIRMHTNAPYCVKSDGTFLRMSDLGVEPVTTVDETTGAETTTDPIAVYDEADGTFKDLAEATSPALTGVPEANGVAVITAFDNLKNILPQYTPEYVTSITGVSADDIQFLADEYADMDKKINTYMMFGDNHYINGHYNYWPIYLTSWFTGHVGSEGNACGFAEAIPVTANLLGTLYVDTQGNYLQGQGPSYIDNKINALLDTGTYGGWEVSANYDETIPASGNVDTTKGGDPATPLKGVYVMCSNPLANHARHDYTVEWFKKLDYVVVADMSMTETAKYADLILPTAHWFEQEDLFTSYANHLYMLMQDKCIEPVGEAKPDYEIWKTLAEGLGYPDVFGEMTAQDYIKLWVEGDTNASLGITYDQLAADKAVKFMPVETMISYADGAFNTGDGRGAVYSEAPTPDYYVGQRIDYSHEVQPYWEPAIEADVNSEARKTYPFYLLSEHMRTRTHSQWWDVDYLKEYEPEPCVKISPADAEAYGIQDGDTVRMFNDRGTVTLKAYINAGLPQGMLAAPRAWQAEEFIDGHYASLPTNEFNQVAANFSFNDVAVDLEKL